MTPFTDTTQEIKETPRPIVALESTIITHGLPHPTNIATALEVEQIIRDEGCVPATIAILKGRIKIGLSQSEIESLGVATDIRKTSRRDLPGVIATGASGSTTVATTMFCAARAGIPIFVTGGIGGVHRGGEDSLDISADLLELGRTNTAVVCAGAKAILDIGRTLEYLETLGVPVLGYATENFPAFYSRSSGFGVDLRVDSAGEVARFLAAKWGLGLQGGVLIGNPPPVEQALERVEMEGYIGEAVRAANERGVRGKELTPFLLSEIAKATGGRSLTANVGLIKSNARVGAGIAKAYQEFSGGG